MVAIGVNDDGYLEVVGAAGGLAGSSECRRGFPLVAEVLRPEGREDAHRRQGGGHGGVDRRGVPRGGLPTLHFYRSVLAKVPRSRRAEAAAMPKAIHAMRAREASEAKALAVAPEPIRLGDAVRVVREGCAETLACTRPPAARWGRVRTNDATGRSDREIRRRTRVVGTFPDGRSALMPVAVRLKYVAESEWGSRRYLDVTLQDG